MTDKKQQEVEISYTQKNSPGRRFITFKDSGEAVSVGGHDVDLEGGKYSVDTLRRIVSEMEIAEASALNHLQAQRYGKLTN